MIRIWVRYPDDLRPGDVVRAVHNIAGRGVPVTSHKYEWQTITVGQIWAEVERQA